MNGTPDPVFCEAEERAARESQLSRLTPEDMLCELLAVMHSDGGHYLDAHGFPRAVAEAERKWYAKTAALEASIAAPAAETANALEPPAVADKCYSLDEETFHDEMWDVLMMLDDDGELMPGVTIYEGETVTRKAGHYLPGTDWLLEQMGEQAADDCGDFVPVDWPGAELPDDKVAELEALLRGWMDANVPVTFWSVVNVKPIEVTAEMIADFRGEAAPPSALVALAALSQAASVGTVQPQGREPTPGANINPAPAAGAARTPEMLRHFDPTAPHRVTPTDL